MSRSRIVPDWRARVVVGGLAAVALGCSLLAPLTASADPIAAKQAQARALADEIDALGRKEAALSEQYDKATIDMQAAQVRIDHSAGQVAQADVQATKTRSRLRDDAVNAYVHGGVLQVLASRSGVAAAGQMILRAQYVKALAAIEKDHLDAFRMASAQAKEAKAAFEASRRQAANIASQLDTARNATVAADRQLRAALGQVKGEIATLVAQAEAAKQAEALRQAQAALARQQAAARQAQQLQAQQAQLALARQQATAQAALEASRSRTPTATPSPPTPVPPAPEPPPVPVGSGGAAAVAAARTRLGDPYVWGAAGPNEFDCSGLTMWAWAHAGVSLPHYSGDQYASIAHISLADLQPGDLVFPASPGDHVAMYIGGGQVIAAPHSGAFVEIEPLYIGFYVLAGRP